MSINRVVGFFLKQNVYTSYYARLEIRRDLGRFAMFVAVAKNPENRLRASVLRYLENGERGE